MATVKHRDLTGDDRHENKRHTHPASEISDFDAQLSAQAQSKAALTVGPAPADHVTDGTADNVHTQQAIDAFS